MKKDLWGIVKWVFFSSHCQKHKLIFSNNYYENLASRLDINGEGNGKPLQYFFPGESPWTEELVRLQAMGSQSWTQLSYWTCTLDVKLTKYGGYPVRVGLWRSLSAEELMLLNWGVGEDSWESLGLQGDPTSPFWRRSALGFLWKKWC